MNIAVIIPCHRDFLSPDEKTSLNHFQHHLAGFDTVIVKPNSLHLSSCSLPTINFLDHFFFDIPAYSRLLLTPNFYERFIEYDFIFIYQLDALVFSSDLASFCQQGYDYIGAPIFKRYSQSPVFSRVGNGGLSLRRVGAFLDVLNSTRYTREKIPILKELFTARIPDLGEWSFPRRWLKKLRVLSAVRMGVEAYTQQYGLNEDLFWSDRAQLFHPGFKIAPIDTALKFSFDKHPRYCFEKNHHQLPFGCHAWAKWDRAFWEPYLLT